MSSSSSAKSTTAEELDGQLCADEPQIMGADLKAHTEAWDRNIPSDSRGDTIARRCTENALQVVNAESARGTPSARTAQHPTSPFRRTASSPIGRTALTGQRSLHHPPCFPIGDDDTPTVVLGPNRKLLAWKKADWNKPSEVFSQLCRNTCDLTKMNSREERVVLGMRAATKATVPAWNHQPSPFWTP
ncbi:hypothetical protein C4B63_30g151 [Trypanosoma cruzi]|uniref:Uncharacterized protein n=1 Tax=Trypanosoma cruzi TaxID=5693 RepID=A0A2V2VEU6_TRYCR|nr:hypothetical protein C4B63_30g151 [Trypanosoma cruzi]